VTADPALTAAQRRVRDEVLAWGGDRPVVPATLVADVGAALANAVAAGMPPSTGARGRQVVGASTLARPPGTGPPQRHDAATVRGVLLAAVVAADLAAGQVGDVTAVVARAVEDLGSARPGDPASPSTWWNAASPAERDAIRDEVVAVCADLRGLWPPLDADRARVSIGPGLRATVPGQPVVLTARPLVVVDSPRRDERARAVVLVARTGMPRPREDRLLARITALVLTLATGRPPFRWGILHVTVGRLEVEDLDADVLLATAATAGARVGTVLADRAALGRGHGPHRSR
jgi:hypothetical protein